MKSNWLQQRRKELELSQEDLVARLELEGFNFSRAIISHWERGRNPLPIDDPHFRRALSRVLRMSIPELLRAEGYELADNGESEAARRAAYIVDQLPPEKREMAIRILEQIWDTNFATTG